VPEIGIFRNCFAKEKPVDQVHKSVDRTGVAGPRFHRGHHSGRRQGLTRARPSGRSRPRRLAARVPMGRVRHGVTGGPLTGARTTVSKWRTGGGASAPSGHGAGTIEEGRRQGEGVRCSTGVWEPFYRVGSQAGAGGSSGRRR
jgi:hypothetical protein